LTGGDGITGLTGITGVGEAVALSFRGGRLLVTAGCRAREASVSNLSLTGDGSRVSGDRGGDWRFETVDSVVPGEILRRFPPRPFAIRSDHSLVEFVGRTRGSRECPGST
jgi:hypothetical protein